MKFLYTFITILIFNVANAQKTYYEEWYSAELENIPQNSIKSIVPDKYGFIWMTTENGLLRFDGKNFKIFNSGNSNLVSNRFSYITGNIKSDSLQTHTGYYEDEILINKRTITKQKKSVIYNSDYKVNYEDLFYYSNSVNADIIDFKNTKITCNNGNYYKIGVHELILYNKKNKIIKALQQNYKEGHIYILLNNDLIILNYKENSYTLFTDEFKTNYKLTIPKDAKIIYNPTVQQLFLYCPNAILLAKRVLNQVYFDIVYSKTVINMDIKSLYFDKVNTKLFIGTVDKGLNVVSLNNFKILVNPNHSSNNYYGNNPLSENEFVTSKGEIYNEKGIQSQINIDPVELNYSLTVDHNKNLWIPNKYTLTKYLKSSNYKQTKKYVFKEELGTVYCDSKNTIWISISKASEHNAGVYTIDANAEDSQIPKNKNINEIINFFTENQKGEILMAAEKDLLIYDPKKQKLLTVPALNNQIRSIFIAKDNSVWICTYNNGFSLFKNNAFYKMPYDNKMYLLSSHCIKEDKTGHFWISTNKGLIEVSKQSLLNYHKKKTPVYYQHYNIKNGFLTNEFNGGCQPCATELNNNYLFPSLNGIVLFNPENVKKIIPSNNFFINEVDLDGKSHYFQDTIYVPRYINRIKFKVDFPYLGNQDNVSFDVKFNISENDNWVTLTDKEISYTNLPPGNHTFYVRKIKPFTSIYEVKKITVIIPFLFYEKLWFKIVLTLLVLSFFIIAFKLRLRHISNRNLILEEIIKERTTDLSETVFSLKSAKNSLNQKIFQQKKLIGAITHDIKSPLKFLTITAKHVYDNSFVAENKNLKDNAKVMQESAAELYRFVENLVDYSKVFIEQNDIKHVPKENIDTIILEKITLFKNLANENKTTINYKNCATTQINLNKKVLGIIIHNLLDNAIKNTFNGTIVIETKLVESKVYLSIKDTGLGMAKEITAYYNDIQNNYENENPEVKTYGLGLHMVLELLNLVDGTMKLQSNEGEGTNVTIILETS